MSALGHAQTLRNVLENARYEHECAIEHLTVLDSQADPYRLDTPIHHLNAKWAARQVGRFFQTHERVHLRGLHYALVIQGNVRKPDGKIYRNTDDDWQWLVGRAMKAARWLGYIPFDRISDQRNSEPIIHRERAAREPTAKHLSASVWTGEVAFDLGPIHVSEPHGWLSGFEREQPYALAIFGEKASLEPVSNDDQCLSQTTVASVSKEGTACIKIGSVKCPTVSNDDQSGPFLGLRLYQTTVHL
jgi:hypothetical protein